MKHKTPVIKEITTQISQVNTVLKTVFTPKTVAESKPSLDLIFNNINNNTFFNIDIIDDTIKIYDNNNILSNENIKLYKNNDKNIAKIIASFIKKYHYEFDVKFACLIKEVGNPVLYIFLLPVVSTDGYYLIKVGFTKNINNRYSELKNEFNFDKIYLLYIFQINGEHIEINLHNELKKLFSTNIYRMRKKNVENSSISEETYIYSFTLLDNIIKILYRTYIMTDKLAILNKELQIKELDNALKIKELKIKELDNALKIKELDNALKIKELKIKKLDNDLKSKELQISNNALKIKELDYELEKLKLEKLKLEKL